MKSLVALSLVAALATPALSVELPEPPLTQSINCAEDGADACARLELLKHLFGDGVTQIPSVCHFSLVSTPTNPNPRYRARRLALVCSTNGVWGESSILFWKDGDDVITVED